jgi:LacI family transcriptional regulator
MTGMKKKGEVTIYDISRALNISASTVSRGLNNSPQVRKELRKKIMNKAREMGYQHNKFASNLRQKRTKTLGVVIPRIDSHFMSTVISGMEKVANNAGYQLLISQSEESATLEEANIQALFNSRVDGLLVSLTYETKTKDAFADILRKDIPLVFFDRVFDCGNCVSVVIDNYRAGYEATQHLIDQGCRKIAHIAGSLNRNVYNDRYRGYRQALTDNSMDFNDKMLIITDLGDDLGVSIINHLLNSGTMPDGIFTANDSSAVSLICELKRKGFRVPDDVAIVGFNDDPVSRIVEPNLTTVHYPGRAMGEVAASTMIRLLEGEQFGKINSITLSHELIIRQSSIRQGQPESHE